MIRVQFAMKRPPAHADFFGGQRTIAIGLFQGVNNQLFLRLLHCQIISRKQWRLAGTPARTAAHRWRQIAGRNFFTPAQNHRVLNGRAQLAHVARPGIIHEPFKRVGREIVHGFAVLAARIRAKTSAPAAECRPAFRARAADGFPPRAAGKTNPREMSRP